MLTAYTSRPMRAVVHDRYGTPEVLRVEAADPPVPNDGEVLIRVRATTVSRTDCHVRRADPFLWRLFLGLRRPRIRILGSEFAGEVEAVGAAVTRFAPGDRVFGTSVRFGAHAEFVCLRETARIAHMPDGMRFEDAAAICDGLLKALSALQAVDVQEGRRIVVYGASGAIGTASVQLAKNFGAHVTAVCNTKNFDLVRSLGADEVVDYTREDFTRNGETYDVIHDAVGKHSFRRCRRSLKPGGVYLASDLGFLWHVPFFILATKYIGKRRVRMPLGQTTQADVDFVKNLIESGAYRAVVDRCYPLEDVIDATRYVETEQKVGNVVLTVG
jgi:NADPH:quinone reductase-like Zn-dependent oxidoreductase